jgi:hypothetical protein
MMDPLPGSCGPVTLAVFLPGLGFVTWRQSRALETLRELDELRRSARRGPRRADRAGAEHPVSRESRRGSCPAARARLGMHTPTAPSSSSFPGSPRHEPRIRSRPPAPWRRRLVLAGWLLGLAAVSLRAGQVQIVQAAEWGELAEAQHRTDVAMEAPRGTDARPGRHAARRLPRAIRVSVAPREIRDIDAVRELLTRGARHHRRVRCARSPLEIACGASRRTCTPRTSGAAALGTGRPPGARPAALPPAR